MRCDVTDYNCYLAEYINEKEVKKTLIPLRPHHKTRLLRHISMLKIHCSLAKE